MAFWVLGHSRGLPMDDIYLFDAGQTKLLSAGPILQWLQSCIDCMKDCSDIHSLSEVIESIDII